MSGSVLSTISQAYYSAVGSASAWKTQRVVRTMGDVRAMADWALNAATSEKPAYASAFAAAHRQINARYPLSMSIPSAFAVLVATLNAAPDTKYRVQQKAKEYYQNVELGGSSSTAAPQTVAFQPSTPGGSSGIPTMAPVQPDLMSTISAIPWYVPVGVAAVAALVIVRSKGKR